jgi:UDP-glucose 6-dehydrogenase
MHIAVPYVGDGQDFFNAVAKRVEKVKPEMIINHSTVPIGTNKLLEERL